MMQEAKGVGTSEAPEAPWSAWTKGHDRGCGSTRSNDVSAAGGREACDSANETISLFI